MSSQRAERSREPDGGLDAPRETVRREEVIDRVRVPAASGELGAGLVFAPGLGAIVRAPVGRRHDHEAAHEDSESGRAAHATQEFTLGSRAQGESALDAVCRGGQRGRRRFFLVLELRSACDPDPSNESSAHIA